MVVGIAFVTMDKGVVAFLCTDVWCSLLISTALMIVPSFVFVSNVVKIKLRPTQQTTGNPKSKKWKPRPILVFFIDTNVRVAISCILE